MRILIIEHPSNKIRGQITRYMYEVSPNRFVGNISKTIANKLWEMLEKEENIQATFVEPCDNEQGFSIRNIGFPSYSMSNFDGVSLFSRKPNNALFLATHSISKSSGKTVVAHLVDVASVCEVLCKEGYYKKLVETLCRKAGVNAEDFVCMVTWVCAFHDVGKICPDFQENILKHACYDEKGVFEEFLNSNALLQKMHQDVRHEAVSKYFLQNYFVNNNTYVNISNPRRIKMEEHLQSALNLVGMHHQGKGGVFIEEDSDVWEGARCFCYEALSKIYPYKKIGFLKEYENVAFLLALGIINTSDFIGSGDAFLGFNVKNIDEVENYRQIALNKAREVLEKAGFLYKEEKALKFSDIFPCIKDKRPMQLEAEESFSFFREDVNFVMIEDVCGSGKTESGFAICNALSNENHGLYVALPTHATSVAMLPRIKAYLSSIGSNYKAELLTSKAMFVENTPELEQEEMEFWVNNTYHKMAFPYSVGTIDQLLRGVRKEKYGLIRLFSSLSKVVLLDEIHSYDSYMMNIIEAYLSFCRIFDTPIVMMSASLDKETKKRLVKAASGLDYEPSDSYPLVTYGTNTGIVEKSIPCWHKIYERNIQLLPYLNDLEQIANHVTTLSKTTGGCIGVVLNMVFDAIEVYKMLKNKLPKDTEVVLLHSKFYEVDKEECTQKILKMLGRDRSHRPKNCIVVSTQILEQSIDIDFDILCSQISPVDALIQRMGRLWRHEDIGTIREDIKIKVPFYIYTSDNTDFGKHGRYIYQESVLKETHSILSHKKSICIPEDIRYLVDEVYKKAETEDNGSLASHGNISVSDVLEDRKDSWITEPNIRYSTYDVENLCIVKQEVLDMLEEYDFPYEMCLHILQHSTVSSVSSYKCDKLSDTKYGKGLLKGYLLCKIPNNMNEKEFFYSMGKCSVLYSKEYGFEIY